jgi:formylglycine-generating enzyme required for sulfatase activity
MANFKKGTGFMLDYRLLAALAVISIFPVNATIGADENATIRVTIGATEAVFSRISPHAEKIDYPDFYMQQTEVTNEQYRQFLKDTNRTKDDSEVVRIVEKRRASGIFSTGDVSYSVEDPTAIWKDNMYPTGEKSFPVCLITLEEASGFCKWLTDKNPKLGTSRLPTWNEWMIAAYGSRRNYPWGDKWDKSLLHASYGRGFKDCPKRTENVTARPLGRTPQGLFGMLGNAAELINDGDPTSNDYFNLGARWMGGGFTDGLTFDKKINEGVARNDYWGYSHYSTLRECDLGFRVVLDPSRDEKLLQRPRLFKPTNRGWMISNE